MKLAFILIKDSMLATYVINIIEFTIVLIFLSLLLNNILSYWKNKIKQAESAEDAITYRIQLKWTRWILLLLFTVVYYGFGLYFNKDNLTWEQAKYLLLPILSLLITNRGYRDVIGNVSVYSKSSFLKKHPNFALYLRGFVDDIYDIPKPYVDNKTRNGFSEADFTEALENVIPLCAVGMTQETDAPYGAIRVYLDDSTWKKDVRELMEKAKTIFILANDRPSCVWEIEQSTDLIEKTYLIVDNPFRYEGIRKELAKELNLPEYRQLNIETPFCMFWKNEYRIGYVPHTISFTNSKKGYQELILGLFGEEYRKLFNEDSSMFGKIIKYFWIFALILILIFLNLWIIWHLTNIFNTNSIIFYVALFAVLVGIEWVIYMLIKVSGKKQ